MRPLSFETLDATEFEQFCFDLLQELGFVNVDWRKGTGLGSSPADRGRDIVAQWERVEVDKSRHFETWFVDCKHYRRGVPAEKLQGLLAWAEAERPGVALVIASGALSNTAKDYIKDYETNRKPPFRIKYWERPTLERLASGRDRLVNSYLLAEGLRSVNEIVAAEQEFFDKLWFYYHLELRDEVLDGRRQIKPEIWEQAKRNADEVVKRYGGDEMALLPEDDFDLGMMNGKLSALRWVLGTEWDFLDL